MQFYRTAVKFKGCISQGKNLSAVQETHIQSLGQEDPLEKGMATHTSILAWRIPNLLDKRNSVDVIELRILK